VPIHKEEEVRITITFRGLDAQRLKVWASNNRTSHAVAGKLLLLRTLDEIYEPLSKLKDNS